MKAARLVVLGVAVAAGGIAAFLAASNKEPAPPPPPPQAALETVEVLVAKSDLTRGQVIDAADIGWQTWPAAAANSSFIKKSEQPNAMDQFVGAMVRVGMVAGDPIRGPYVVMAKGSGFMAAVLPEGMRAAAVDIAPDTSAGGFILPDDRVDVLLTRRDKDAEKQTGVEKYVSDTILRNIRVLAIDQTIDDKNSNKTLLGKTATLELTQPQAEMLSLSRQVGTVSLALRSIRDSKTTAEGVGDTSRDESGAINTVRFGVSTLGSGR
ncbi:MAG TPA: Flp pilus assembly protein CpaB [Xanthobacteraceae bacterium]|jgi:pilus assembly protein CpaB|nr:Flp pilus assembly protein CpaB [Xanthobacteraceae bacterium]